MEPGKIKCIFPSKGTATVAWSDGTRPLKMSQKKIDVSQPDVAKEKHAVFDANADDDGGESDLSPDDKDDDDDESGLRRSARKKPKKA